MGSEFESSTFTGIGSLASTVTVLCPERTRRRISPLGDARKRVSCSGRKVSDFHQDGEQATIRLHEKGDKRRTIGLHFQAAQAIGEYIEHGELESGPLFRPLLNPRSKKLASRPMDAASLYRLVQSYMKRLPGAAKMVQTPSSPCAAANSADALRTSGSAALIGLPRDSIPQIRRAPGLPFETEDRPVDVGLSQQDAGVVHQSAHLISAIV
jgi:hypothetical protein